MLNAISGADQDPISPSPATCKESDCHHSDTERLDRSILTSPSSTVTLFFSAIFDSSSKVSFQQIVSCAIAGAAIIANNSAVTQTIYIVSFLFIQLSIRVRLMLPCISPFGAVMSVSVISDLLCLLFIREVSCRFHTFLAHDRAHVSKP